MKIRTIAFYLLAVILGGCLPSLHPLYTDDVLVFEEGLIGKWVEKDGSNIWQFEKDGDNAYRMRLRDGDKEALFTAHLVKLEAPGGDMLFLDIFPDGQALKDLQDFYRSHLLPMHTFMRVDQTDPNLVMRLLNVETVSNMLGNDPNLLRHESIEDGDRIVLTAHPRQLQEFMIKYADEKDMFGEPTELVRLRPLYTDEDLIFDANLIGEWEAEDGEMVDSAKLGEKAYDIRYIAADGTQQQCTAHLVELKGIKFLCVFFDKSTLSGSDLHSLHLVPDAFFAVGQTDPMLLLESVSREDIAELLEHDFDIPQETPSDTNYAFEGVRVYP